jgi:putative redox protein
MEVTVKHLGDVKFEIGARRHTLICDQPAENGGHDEGMTPPEFFLGSLGSCAAFYAVAYLKKKGLPREGVEVRVTAEKAGPPARLDNFKIEVQVPTPLSEADRIGVDDAVHRCLIHNTLLHPPTVRIELKAPVNA